MLIIMKLKQTTLLVFKQGKKSQALQFLTPAFTCLSMGNKHVYKCTFSGAVWACRHGVVPSGKFSYSFRYEIKIKCTQKGLRGSEVVYIPSSALKKHSGTVPWLVNWFLLSLWVSNSETTRYIDIMYPRKKAHHLKFFAKKMHSLNLIMRKISDLN